MEVSRETCSGAALALRELIPSFFFIIRMYILKYTNLSPSLDVSGTFKLRGTF